MHISSQFVGTPLKTYQSQVSWRDTMNYAAAIKDANPLYFDDECKQGIIAPPMFAVATTWPIIENIPDFIEADHFPEKILITQVHYTEHIRFHRPLSPGQAITIKGRIAAILPHRAGTQIVTCLEAQDQNAEPVFTEHIGAMMRGVECDDSGSGKEAVPAVPERGSDDRLRWELSLSIDPLLPFVYDGCTNIVFPIHTSQKFARQVGLSGIILQGTATLALAVSELINREADGNPLKLKEIYCRFTGMVRPGSEIRLQVYGSRAGKNVGAIFFDVINQEGDKAISHGYALF
jgi:acyl dehydratase